MTTTTCSFCGVHLISAGLPHAVAVTVDGTMPLSAVVCVRCRDSLLDALSDAWGDAESASSRPIPAFE